MHSLCHMIQNAVVARVGSPLRKGGRKAFTSASWVLTMLMK